MQAESLAERYVRLAQETPGRRGIDRALRLLDVVLSAFLLVVLSPAWLAIASAIAISSGRPVFYRGQRVGLGGRVFTMFKFRTLQYGAEARLGTSYGDELTHRTQAETTRLGGWLRATQLDETAQLWNVLRGEMSLVGPRPVRPAFFEGLAGDIPQYWQRLVVRPGLTGFAQTRMGREDSWAEKLAHDLEWIADRSFRLYLRTVATTGWHMLKQLGRELLRRS
jgi:lipopolysaccharide/colanic/teichoic acid biosynthesis glycosyltransferase